jgi:hypothetical protein
VDDDLLDFLARHKVAHPAQVSTVDACRPTARVNNYSSNEVEELRLLTFHVEKLGELSLDVDLAGVTAQQNVWRGFVERVLLVKPARKRRDSGLQQIVRGFPDLSIMTLLRHVAPRRD